MRRSPCRIVLVDSCRKQRARWDKCRWAGGNSLNRLLFRDDVHRNRRLDAGIEVHVDLVFANLA